MLKKHQQAGLFLPRPGNPLIQRLIASNSREQHIEGCIYPRTLLYGKLLPIGQQVVTELPEVPAETCPATFGALLQKASASCSDGPHGSNKGQEPRSPRQIGAGDGT